MKGTVSTNLASRKDHGSVYLSLIKVPSSGPELEKLESIRAGCREESFDISLIADVREARRVVKLMRIRGDRDWERWLCRWDLRYLCQVVLGYKDWDLVHDRIAEFVFRCDREKKTHILILVARGHLKSSVVTVGRSIQELLNYPDLRILIANAIWDNARGFLKEIAGYLTTYSRLAEIFGPFKRGHKEWGKDAVTIAHRTKPLAAASVTTTGVERVQASQHYDRIVFDDVVVRENISTKEQIEKVKKFYSDSESLLEPTGRITVIGTTWHEDDLYNTLLESGTFEVFRQPALDPPDLAMGVPVFPKKFSRDILIKKRDRIGEFEFSSQYLLDPYPVACQEFKDEWIRPYINYPDPRERPLYVTLCLDPSMGKERGDFAGMVSTAHDAEGNVWVILARRAKCSVEMLPAEFARAAIDTIKAVGRLDIVGIEGFAFQQLLEEPIRKAFNLAGVVAYIEVLPRDTSATKDFRISRLIPPMQAGRVFIREDAYDLREELQKYKPNVRYRKDDLLDAMAWCERFWMRPPMIEKREDLIHGSFEEVFRRINARRRGNDIMSDFRN